MQENGFANYFEVTDALAELTANGSLAADGDPPVYHAVSQTKLIAGQLDKVLPLSVREKAIAAAVNLLAKARREQENKVTIQQTSKGYNVHCHISGGDLELMNISLYVPDEHQAKLVPQGVSQITGDGLPGVAGIAHGKSGPGKKSVWNRL